MSDHSLELGIVGLGSIGGNLARQAVGKDFHVVGVTTSDHPQLAEMGVEVHDAGEYDAFSETLDPPRVIYLSLPAGEIVDDELDSLLDHLDEGDVVMDGGNSFWRDSIRREERSWDEGVYFLDAGTSGGPPRARDGVCFMVGGREAGFEIAEPHLDALSVDGGLIHVGPPGSGHFVKLVHNGIEFGMMQAIAEGVELLEAGQFDLDGQLADLFETWTNGAVIESWLVELLAMGLRQEDQQSDAPAELEAVPNVVEDTGEVNWLVQEAFKGETPIPVITQSVIELFKSRGNQRQAYRAIALMRHGFGGHPFGEDEAIMDERITGRVDNVSRNHLRGDRENLDTVRPEKREPYPADPSDD